MEIKVTETTAMINTRIAITVAIPAVVALLLLFPQVPIVFVI